MACQGWHIQTFTDHHPRLTSDFDLTLTTSNVGMFDVADAVRRCFGSAERVAMLRALMQVLESAGVESFVVTRNSAHIVGKALRADGVELAGYFVRRGRIAAIPGAKVHPDPRLPNSQTSVIGNETTEYSTPKSAVILDILHGVRPSAPSELLFVDDEPANITDVGSVFSGVCTLIQPATIARTHGRGMTEGDCARAAQWARDERA